MARAAIVIGICRQLLHGRDLGQVRFAEVSALASLTTRWEGRLQRMVVGNMLTQGETIGAVSAAAFGADAFNEHCDGLPGDHVLQDPNIRGIAQSVLEAVAGAHFTSFSTPFRRASALSTLTSLN